MTTPLIEAIARAGNWDGPWNAQIGEAERFVTAITEAGYAVVPIEPTEAMIEHGLLEARCCTDDWTSAAACLPSHVYRAMIQAGKAKG